jgi:hypothetical protein
MGNWWRKLTSFIKSLPKGLTLAFFPKENNYPLMLKSAISSHYHYKPKIFLWRSYWRNGWRYCKKIIDFITSDKHKWTIIVSSKNPYWNQMHPKHIICHGHGIVHMILIISYFISNNKIKLPSLARFSTVKKFGKQTAKF